MSSLVACIIAGVDRISDMGLLRHGGMGKAFDRTRAATTLGTHLRGYTFGHVRQLDAVASRLLRGLASRVPWLLAGAEAVAYVDIDDTIRETHGYAKQGSGYGYSGVKGLNAQVATLSTLQAAPVIAGIRLRRGASASAHGAGKLIGESLAHGPPLDHCPDEPRRERTDSGNAGRPATLSRPLTTRPLSTRRISPHHGPETISAHPGS